MLVVHGCWLPGQLALWAEEPALPLASASRARDRPHPFAVSADVLLATLEESSGDVRDALVKAMDGTLGLRLPGTGSGPLPSPETGSEVPRRGVRLTTWQTPALLIPGDAALGVLGALAEPDPDGPWSAAASLRYLCVLAGHACDMARRGRMLPQLVTEAAEAAARWRPVITGADAATFRDFASAMPPVCRAAGELSVGDTLRDALEAMVDGAARAVMPERLLLGHRPGPKAPLPDRWALALTSADPTLPGGAPAEVAE
ncbi:ATP-dependent helicase, partial [Actinoplanes sp. NPDC051633]